MAEETTVTDSPKGQAKAERRPRHLPGWIVSLIILGLAGVIFLLVFGSWDHWQSDRSEQRTDDAYVRADVASLSTKASGTVLTMAVEEYQHVNAGQVIATLKTDDYQTQVESAQAALDGTIDEIGELTEQKRIADAKVQQARVAISASQQQVAAAEAAVTAAQAAVTAAQAGIAAAQAQLKNAREERARQEGLFSKQATTLETLQSQVARSDEAQAQADSQQSQFASAQAQVALRKADLERAEAAVESSKLDMEEAQNARKQLDAKQKELQSDIQAKHASLNSAKINLGYTTITAPVNGYIATRSVLPGQTVGPGTTIVTLVEGAPWIIANFKETQVSRMASGDEANIHVDAFPSRRWRGRVLIVAPESGAASALIPPDNATGNFTKIVQRIPVKITLAEDQNLDLLRPGMSVTATVRVGSPK
jgi:membrane fusion protein, multidrug efflux system